MGTYTQKDTTAIAGLEALAELFKLLGPAAAKPRDRIGSGQTRGGPGEEGRDAEKASGVEQGKPARRVWRSRPLPEEIERLRAELDDIGLAFRLCKSSGQRPEGWMRAIRRAIGIPVIELARRMGVRKAQIFRLEESEQQGRVRIETLRRVAEAMGCEFVYALVPREGKLASMAAVQRAEEEAKRERAAAERKLRKIEEQTPQWIPRGETIRQECERLGIAAEIYGQ